MLSLTWCSSDVSTEDCTTFLLTNTPKGGSLMNTVPGFRLPKQPTGSLLEVLLVVSKMLEVMRATLRDTTIPCNARVVHEQALAALESGDWKVLRWKYRYDNRYLRINTPFWQINAGLADDGTPHSVSLEPREQSHALHIDIYRNGTDVSMRDDHAWEVLRPQLVEAFVGKLARLCRIKQPTLCLIMTDGFDNGTGRDIRRRERPARARNR